MENILVKNGFLPTLGTFSDVLIKDGKIVKIGKGLCGGGALAIDAKGKYVLPGIIDAHTHYHLVSRGTVTADSFPQGSRLAVYGGVTTVVDFADHDKTLTLKESAEKRRAEMQSGMAVDYALHEGVYGMPEDIEDRLGELKKAGVTAVKLFTTYKNVGYMIDNPLLLDRLFAACKKLGILVTVHCEDDALIQKINDTWSGTYLPADHADLRPSEVEAKGIGTVGEIAYKHDMPLYVVHLSSEAGLEKVRELRGKGAKIIVETTPTYLFLERSKLEGPEGSLYVMTPPLRTEKDNKALKEAVLNGEIDILATDHCSFTYAQKMESCDVRTIYPGIPGTEELFALAYTYFVEERKMDFKKLYDLLSLNPAKTFGLFPRKGAIAEGSDADIIIFNPGRERVLTKQTVHSACGYTPYEGTPVKGEVEVTIRRGEILLKDGQYYGKEGTGMFIEEKQSASYAKKCAVLANDHGAVELAARFKAHLQKRGYEVFYLGTDKDESCDYPDFAEAAVKKFRETGAEFGVLCCGTGIGISMAANKMDGIRAAVVQNSFAARATKEHNNANFICFGGRIDYQENPEDILDAYIDAVFQGGRHQRRIDKIAALAGK